MDLRLVARQLGIISMLIGATMVFSLPWAHPALGRRTHPAPHAETGVEWVGICALLLSLLVCLALGALLLYVGRRSTGQLFRKEAMAVVGLSWMLATILGALPYYFCGTYRAPAVRLFGQAAQPLVYRFGMGIRPWNAKRELPLAQYQVIKSLLDAGAGGLEANLLKTSNDRADAYDLLRQLAEDPHWDAVILSPDQSAPPGTREANYRIRWIRMNLVDALFESQSGFSTTGATVITNLEDPRLVPYCILFWRSSTHFLGGLGIIVLFVAVLGQGSAGKVLMRAEMPGPSKEGIQTLMQHTAWVFAGIYCGLTVALVIVLCCLKLTPFDAFCHAFGTMATGGFSTYNKSIRQFDSVAIDATIICFMVLAGTNFVLLYAVGMRKPGKLLADVEWRTYVSVIAGVSLVVILFGLAYGDFQDQGESIGRQVPDAVRYGLFQVVSIITTTGYVTDDFDSWNSFGRGILLLLMFVGACAGSTGGGMKVIRHILFIKILGLEIEQAHHPSVVRPIKLGGRAVDDPNLRKNIMVYFGLILVIFVFSWILLVTIEPDATWGDTVDHKLIDSASAIAATVNNIGPGLGIVGATNHYSYFSVPSKITFTWLMMVGRLEIFTILVLFSPRFWRTR